MGIFKTLGALSTVNSELKRYNKNIPDFDKLREQGDDKAERALVLEKAQDFASALSRRLGVSYVVEGMENIPDNGPLLVIANHQSYADILAIYYVMSKFQIGFVAKSELQKWPALARCISYTRSVFINRGNGRETLKTLKEVSDMLGRGFSFAVFPEGHRSKSSEMKAFKPGALKFAQKAKVPILPISLDGGYKLFEIDNSYHTPIEIKVKVHPLVHIEDMSRTEQIAAFKEIEQTIRAGVEELAEEE